MRTDLFKTFRNILLALIPVLISSTAIFGQARCVSDDEIKAMLAKINSTSSAPLNQELRDKLVTLKEKAQQSFQDNIAEGRQSALLQQMRTTREENTAWLCPILKEFGWPGADFVGTDGVAAAFYLLKNSSSFELQRALLPVIIAATKKGDIERASFAGFLDRLRLTAGLKQLFGTQATISKGFLVLYPIDSEVAVDQRRKQYGLPPLREYISGLERTYQLPLVKSPGALTNKFVGTPNAALARTSTSLFTNQAAAEDDEVIRVDTSLASLNVGVSGNQPKTRVPPLEQKDFVVFEDGHEESVSFFAATDAPFDLVLLLDLSGSTANKRDLISKTTRRFIEAARPSDRLAIVTFSNTVNIVSPLTSDRQQLLDSLKKIKGEGGSNVWEALNFTLDQIIGPNTTERRRAVVFMTDGVDNQLMGGFGGRGSNIDFSDLLETVRRSDTLIIPIYLDTEGEIPFNSRVYENARNTLAMLADESGGLYYKAHKIEDLSGIYAQVIEDLGKVYSLGYKPTNEKRDGSWREVKIQIRNRPDLSVRARPGYYAK